MSNLLTQQQVVNLCLSVGFNQTNARIAAAIAMCESPLFKDGKPYANFDAVGDQALANETWGYSYGGFQVRSLRAQKGTGNYRDELKLPDPTFNARSARTIKAAAGSFRPWSTFTSGIYKAYLQDMYPPAKGTHVVMSGDTLSKIAATYGYQWTWQQLAQTNNIPSPYKITIGQVLILPTTTIGA